MTEPRTIVVFRSDAFNTTEQKPSFINDGCFGDDLARWLMTRLRALGVKTTTSQDKRTSAGTSVIGRRKGDTRSFSPIAPKRPLLASGSLQSNATAASSHRCSAGSLSRNISQQSLRTSCMPPSRTPPEVTAIAWHRQSDFDRRNESQGSKSGSWRVRTVVVDPQIYCARRVSWPETLISLGLSVDIVLSARQRLFMDAFPEDSAAVANRKARSAWCGDLDPFD